MPKRFTKGGVLEPADYDTWFNNLRQNAKTSDAVFTPYEDKIIKFELSEKQRRYRDALED